ASFMPVSERSSMSMITTSGSAGRRSACTRTSASERWLSTREKKCSQRRSMSASANSAKQIQYSGALATRGRAIGAGSSRLDQARRGRMHPALLLGEVAGIEIRERVRVDVLLQRRRDLLRRERRDRLVDPAREREGPSDVLLVDQRAGERRIA